eukprot:Skav228890  [mRNA]  locus=scaffold194:166018:168645:+ [translate_table: standard]
MVHVSFLIDLFKRLCDAKITKEDEILQQQHTSELTLVFTGGCPPRTGRSRRVPLSARKVETAAVRCPVQRTRIKAIRKESFNATGEESTYQGTYTGVAFRATAEMPLIAKDEKLKVLDPRGTVSLPSLPDDWVEKNGDDMPLYWNESKPIAFWCALLDDWKVQSVLDLTPGSGALCEASLTRGIQYHGLCQNKEHLQWLQAIADRAACGLMAVEGQRSKVQKAEKQKQATSRSDAVGQGLVPKARRAFALFLMEKTSVGKGATRAEFSDDMKRVGKLWKSLSEQQKKVYTERSRQEFDAQRTAMMQAGIHVRTQLPPNQHCQEPAMGHGPCSGKFKIGPYTIMDQGCKDDVLGGGSYGKVFSSFATDGTSVAIKIFRKRDGEDDAAHEVAVYKRLCELPGLYSRWYPQLLDCDMHGRPFPWMTLSHAGVSMDMWLQSNGSLAPEMIQPFALQLQAAIQTLHSQAHLLHLDIKPGNVLWCSALVQVKLCDFGLSEPYNGHMVQSPRYTEYVTLPYRPPELWNLGADVSSLQSVLSPAVDLWSFGCVVFEVSSGMKLMQPFDSRQRTSRQAIGSWCQKWSEMSANLSRTGGSLNPGRMQNTSSPWLARIKRCSSWGTVVLASCHPEPKTRKWMSLGSQKQRPK